MTNSIKAKLILLFLIVLSHKIKAQIAEGNYYIYSINSFLALTGIKNTDGSSALTLEKNNDKNNNNQIWIIKKNATGYTIKSKANNVCIDVYGSSTKENSEVNLYEETGNINQIFIFEKRGNSYVLKGLESDKYITTNDAKRKPGSNVVQRKNTNTDDQLWGFTPADVAIFAYNEGSLTVMQSELNNKNKNYKINPIPARNAEATRMGRFAPADYLPSGIYVEEGETVTIEASGLANMSQDFLILVGEPNAYWGNKKENNPYEYVLKNGNNSFTTNRSGLLYFNYTNHPFQYYKNNTVLLKITNGGIASPLFIYNKTEKSDWKNQLNSASPFVQFISDKAIITIKKNTFSDNKNVDVNKTFEVLHQVLDYSNELAGFDNTSFFNTISPLRTHYIEDDISTDPEYLDGVYMYAGDVFIGMQTNSVADLINADLLKKQWSIWHETGHLFQTDDWTWDEMGEVTVNLFSLNTQQKFGNKSRIYEPDGYEDKSISSLTKKYLKSNKKIFSVGKKYEMNFVCMVMFEQLRKAFGNKFYAGLNQYYRKNPLTILEVNDEDFVTQEFIFNSCKLSGFDLTNFFQKWGLAISSENARRIKKMKLPISKKEILGYFVE